MSFGTPATRWLLRHTGALAAALLAAAFLSFVVGASGLLRPRSSWFFIVGVSIATLLVLAIWAAWQHERAIREAPLPAFLKRKLRDAFPTLTPREADLVERALRQFFFACHRSRRQFVAMPSRAVDAMWHEFILHTRAYRDWCDVTLGRFLHHTPAEALGADPKRNDGLRRAWFWACRDESIDPRSATRLPLLFAIDAKLGIAGGFRYVPDCRDMDGSAHCGTSFSDSSHSGDGDGLGGSDGGGDGGGCGGGGD